MGMDGLSFANTGTIKEQTSAERTGVVEQAIASDPKNSSTQVQEATNNKRVKEKEEGEGGNGQSGKKFNQSEEFEDGLVTTPTESVQEDFQVEDFDDPNKEFYVKLNIKDDIIELYDSVTNKLIETISGSELEELVHKLNMASGIFVNKKV